MAETASTIVYVLPWWMQWVQVGGVAFISCVGAWIAYRQSRIAAAKLNLDLYDRRFKVFNAAREFATVALLTDIESTALPKFQASTIDAVFLFNEEIAKYLDEFGVKIFQLQSSKTHLEHATTLKARERFTNEIGSQEKIVTAELNVLVDKFKPFLKLGNI